MADCVLMNAPVTEFRRAALTAQIERVVASTPVTDIHTHLYDPTLGGLLLWGIDDLLVYHYLVAEAFRWLEAAYRERHSFMPWMKDNSAYAPLRSDPRFQDLLRRIGSPAPRNP